MHFFKNSVSFIAVMCVCGVAYSAPRVAMTSAAAAAARRLPSLSNVVKSGSVSAATTTTTTSSSSTNVVLSDTDCIDEYRDCMKGENVCGPDFSECTTNVLFHGQMSECFSTLYQCSSTAINSLFGTSNLGNLSTVEKYVPDTNDTEVERYTYPTKGSIMGMDIIGAETRNKLSTSDCVKKYKKCLNKDNICGEDFELCTTHEEFKKQAAMCDSTLSRCQKEGFEQLFGDKVHMKPSLRKLGDVGTDGVIQQWIDDGAALAATNAVNTCYKVIDSCFSNACSKNPYSCVEGVSFNTVTAAENIVDSVSVELTKDGNQTATEVRKFFRAACQDTIGANQYCYMTFNDGKKPTKADLQDEDMRDDVFSDAYDARKEILKTKVNELLKQFDETAKNKCIDTFKSCAMRTCGGGSGAACYSLVNSGKEKSINGNSVYDEIQLGCEAVVNMDANCKYMAAKDGEYAYSFADMNAFKTLFPVYKAGNADSIIVSALNADLSTTYNAAAIEKMQKQCQNVVTNCVRSMCGNSYQNCYRNRSDVFASTYDTGNGAFDKSMNKVGGVLDYTIVQGLCVSTIKSADACTESLAIAKTKAKGTGATAASVGWGNATGGTVGAAWFDSAKGIGIEDKSEQVPETDEQGRELCKCKDGTGQLIGIGVCDTEIGGNPQCTEKNMITITSLIEKQAVNNLFQEVLADVEAEAQAQYNAKLTKEQNICLAQNSGANPNATFVWAKLSSNSGRIPKNYSSHGLGEKGSVPSNDLYNSFCRVKVTLQSEDRDVQTLLGGGKVSVTEYREALGADWMAKDKTTQLGSGNNESFAYFSTGDSFTCGSWISQTNLDAISAKVGAEARKDAGEGSSRDKSIKTWASIGAGLLGAGATAFAYDKLQTSDSLGGFLNKNLAQSKTGDQCADLARDARKKYEEAIRTKDQTKMDAAVRAVNQAKTKLASIDNDKAKAITVPSEVKLESYNTDEIEKEAQEAIEAQDAEFSLVPADLASVNDVIGKVDSKCHNAWASANPENTKGCENAVAQARQKLEAITKEKYTSVTTVDVSGIKSDLNTAISNLKDYHRTNAAKGSKAYYGSTQRDKEYKIEIDELAEYVSNLTALSVEQTKDRVEGRKAIEAVYKQGQRWKQADQESMDSAFTQIEDACEEVSSETVDKGQKKRVVGDVVAGAVGGIATAALASGITSSVQKAKYESAENEAIKDWMDNIGSKIHCYIGGELVGDFGDIVTVNITE